MSRFRYDHRALLLPYANMMHDLEQKMQELPDDERAKLKEACSAATSTNCWAATFRAAQILLPMIRTAEQFKKTA